MNQSQDEPFFIGWAAPPDLLRPFLAGVALGLLLLAGVFAYLVSATQDDPGDGAFMGRAVAHGVLQTDPYPVLHVVESERYEPGTPLILSGNGKIGVRDRASKVDGQYVRAAGTKLERGDLSGLQLANGMNGLRPADGAIPQIETDDLGRWRLTGEICDGKCLIGAMRPGRGLAHKACANLCLAGDVPPVFVATDKVDGSEFFLLANADGQSLGDTMMDYTAIFIEAEGRVEKRGNLNIFFIEEDTVKVIR
ncbi:hypothetical protein [Litoreibacter roseus]|uniref:Uncharacterized protein n=1 Tax=Litoreibacter roseus TaxID=2601869 RepID=A0A6N6JG45_9RHOB|nr:hypothetical protein [Litoreibacter roseus]GFE64182.1 hypothetical protein KIN_12560 [Litoreibacter roseus]